MRITDWILVALVIAITMWAMSATAYISGKEEEYYKRDAATRKVIQAADWLSLAEIAEAQLDRPIH